jgi:hypothetical protein
MTQTSTSPTLSIARTDRCTAPKQVETERSRTFEDGKDNLIRLLMQLRDPSLDYESYHTLRSTIESSLDDLMTAAQGSPGDRARDSTLGTGATTLSLDNRTKLPI